MGETVFTSLAVIGGRLFSNHYKNLNHVNKDSKYLVSVIMTLGKYINGGGNVFYDGVKTYDLGSRANVLKNLHGRIIFGPLYIYFCEGNICRGHRAIKLFILTKQIFLNFYRHVDQFYDRYTNETDKKKHLDDDGTEVNQKKILQREMRYRSGCDPIKKMWVRYRKTA